MYMRPLISSHLSLPLNGSKQLTKNTEWAMSNNNQYYSSTWWIRWITLNRAPIMANNHQHFLVGINRMLTGRSQLLLRLKKTKLRSKTSFLTKKQNPTLRRCAALHKKDLWSCEKQTKSCREAGVRPHIIMEIDALFLAIQKRCPGAALNNDGDSAQWPQTCNVPAQP